MEDGCGFYLISPIFSLYGEVPKGLIISKFGRYSFSGLRLYLRCILVYAMYIKPNAGVKKDKLQTPLPTLYSYSLVP